MFGSYAIAVGRGAHRHALGVRAASLGLPVRVEKRELLLVASEQTVSLCNADSVLVGQAFDGAGERLAELPSEMAAFASSTDPRAILCCTPGNYAFFLASPDQALVYREPSGSVPVYRCGGADCAVFVSDCQTASQLGLIEDAPIDPLFVVHWLQFPFLRTARTGLQTVTELLPGMVMSRSKSGSWVEASAWHPSAFTTAGLAIDDAAEAASRLCETALSMVPAQVRGDSLVLRLSGGLDSSIIAACLSEAGLPFSCINFTTQARDGDERDYAREVAAKFGVTLVEVREPEEVLLAVPNRKSFRPLINPLLEPFERSIAKAAAALGTTLLIDGAGGDNLFCSITSAAPILDALAAGRLRQARRTAGDIATRANCTIWDVLRAAVRKAFANRPLWKEDRSFLLPSALLPACEPHPWLENLAVTPGKREHVEALVHIQHFLDRTPSPIASLHPLLAQPLLELCLRIPSWLWVRGGRDRAIARNAFAGRVPSSVLERRMKGSLQSLLYRSFEQLRWQMKKLLLEGDLVSLGIVAPAAIEGGLAGDNWMDDSVQLRISEMVALELWLRSWRSKPANSSTGS